MNKQHFILYNAHWVGISIGLFMFSAVMYNEYRIRSHTLYQVKPQKIDKISTEVVVMMPSPVHWRNRRDPINKIYDQQQWPAHKVQFFYVLGSRENSDPNSLVNMSTLYDEMEDYKYFQNLRYYVSDCIDFKDDENNPKGVSGTSCKVFRGLQYVSNTYRNYKYVWRGADDAYINLQTFFFKVMPTLDKNPNPAIYMGKLFRNTEYNYLLNIGLYKPYLRDSWHVSDFGDYMFGMGFLLSQPVVDMIAKWNIEPWQTWCEDVVVGEWLRPFQIDWIHAKDRGWMMDHRWAFDATNCQKQLLVHYPEKGDWEDIDALGNMQFCRHRL
jgi:hypothetical protein